MDKFITSVVFAITFLKCASAAGLNQQNFQIGIASIGVQNSESSPCGKELEMFLKSVEKNELWAVKLIDSFGVTPRSFNWGNYLWYPSKEYCEDLNDPYEIALSDRYNHTNSFNYTSPFPVRYWVIYFDFTTPIYVKIKYGWKHYIHVGLCLPRSCSQDEAIAYSQSYFDGNTFDLQRQYDIKMKAVGAKSPEFKWSFFTSTGMLLLLSYLALSVIFMIAADRISKKLSKVKESQPSSKLEEFFLCFHFKDNNQRLWKVDNSKGFLPAIAGLKTFICFWIVLAHLSFFGAFGFTNLQFSLALLENFFYAPILEVWFFVDVFFIVSSFLLVSNFLSNLQQIEAIKMNSLKANLTLYLRLVLGRYMRLLPLMLTAILLTENLYNLSHMSSPLRMENNSFSYCKENWWYNILFLNNYVNIEDMCLAWAWYLGCEMQFFILFTGLLFIFAKDKSLGRSLFVALLVMGVAISFFCFYYYEFTFQNDVILGTFNQVYAKPWTRINAYTGGALIGWLFHRRKDNPTKLNAFSKAAFWIFATSLWTAALIMSYWRSTPVWIVAIIMSFGKLAFALCVGFVIIMCEWGHGGFLNRILSSRVFLFLNKFNFSIYMVSPIVTMAVFDLSPETIRQSEIAMVIHFIAVSLCAIGLSFLVVLLVELPAEQFRSKFIARKKKVVSTPLQEGNGHLTSKKDT